MTVTRNSKMKTNTKAKAKSVGVSLRLAYKIGIKWAPLAEAFIPFESK